MSAALPPGYLERLRELCAIDSPTGDQAGLDACATLIARWASEAGCAVDLLPSPVGLHVVARTHGSGGRRTLLLGHHDTVYSAGTAAARSSGSRPPGTRGSTRPASTPSQLSSSVA